jgi:hypothetical protein
VLPKEVAQMAEFTLEEIMYGEKYNIESSVFMAAYELAKQGIKPADIREHLQMFSYVREAIKTTLRLLKEGGSISDIPEFEPLFLCEEADQCEY